jgi:hypothetical protein
MPNSALSLRPVSIEWFTEDQAFSPSYNSAPHPPTSPIYRQQDVPLYQSSCMCVAGQAYLRERGEGGGKPNQMTARKPGPLSIIQYSLVEMKRITVWKGAMLGGDCLFQECRICGKSKMPFPLPFFHSLCFKFIFLLAWAGFHFFLKLVSNVGS